MSDNLTPLPSPDSDPTTSNLTDPQRTALTAIAHGSSIKDAAQAAGVHRGTLHRWITADPAFRALYNAWLHESRENTQAKLAAVASEAADAVISAIRNGNQRLAYALLKDLGHLSKLHPGLTDPDLLKAQMDHQLDTLKQSLQPPSPNPTALPNPILTPPL